MSKKKKTKFLACSVEGIAYKLSAIRYPLSAKVAISSIIFLLSFLFSCYAENIDILYTGETHAMLYPCTCPIQPDGGVSRRATLIKELRKKNPHSLLIDSGAFFAGGVFDEYAQNVELDEERTRVQVEAMKIMRYDAVGLGDEEFNFGKTFLEEQMKSNPGINFVCANIDYRNLDKRINLKSYIIKEAGEVKFALIGVVMPQAKAVATGFILNEPHAAVQKAVLDAKENGADIIIVLSHLGEIEDERLAKDNPGIDIIISGHTGHRKDSNIRNIGNTIICYPSWQGKKLCKLTLSMKDKKISSYQYEEIRLLDKTSDDTQILNILPRCFSDLQCKKEAMTVNCLNPGTLKAQCIFKEAPKIGLKVVLPRVCKVCDASSVVQAIKAQIPGLKVKYLYYPQAEAKKLAKEVVAKSLPVFLFDKEFSDDVGFTNFKDKVVEKENYYFLKEEFGGVSYFIDRQLIPGKVDVFLSLYDKNSLGILEALRPFNPVVHFLTKEENGKLTSSYGDLEIQDYERALCIQKYYPKSFFDYISCREKNINNSWWEDCAPIVNQDLIKACARGEEGSTLLKENIRLNSELKVMLGPVYLLENQRIFGTRGIPKQEDFKKLIENR